MKKKKTKIWVGIGAFVIAGSGGAALDPLPPVAAALEAAPSSSMSVKAMLTSSTAGIMLAQTQGGEGEGGAGGEGGEAGINVAAAENDPVEYNVALQVIAAHYYAGLAAYEGKESEAGAQMFAHGLSEVYVAMEDVFRKRGVTGLQAKLDAAVDAATSKKPVAQVRARVQDVLQALRLAEKAAPKSSMAPNAVKAKVIANLLHRAASQYSVSVDDKTLEPYLDGLGFSTAARKEAEKVLPWLRGIERKKAAAVTVALKLANTVYPGIKRPTTKVPPDRFLAAASAAQLAVSSL